MTPVHTPEMTGMTSTISEEMVEGLQHHPGDTNLEDNGYRDPMDLLCHHCLLDQHDLQDLDTPVGHKGSPWWERTHDLQD
ncbi:hypothetical protein SCP_0406690 [Sparassis crispa]|uniref:Uncharacterized protein n=1 Tax=Sparassis crispa TaxID=139825 RepID=A0A401GJE9_9APHY|nr:hypothetical protein SCP_0406690 [Sparassis crispa]GBE82285.1 hypothetical protein SCP_0406690 [Sparassis crispa]